MAKFDGGQGVISVLYTVEEPDDYLNEDEYIELGDEIDRVLDKARTLIDREDFDVYDHVTQELKKLDWHLHIQA